MRKRCQVHGIVDIRTLKLGLLPPCSQRNYLPTIMRKALAVLVFVCWTGTIIYVASFPIIVLTVVNRSVSLFQVHPFN